MAVLTQRPPDLDASGQPAGRPPDLDAQGQPIFRQTDTSPNEVDPNTLGTFARHVGSQINPVPTGQILPWPQSLGGAGWDAPLKAGKAILSAQGVPLENAKAALDKGDNVSAAIHLFNYLIPLLGPVLDKSGDELKSGHYAAGLGDAIGLATQLVGGKKLPELAQAATATKPAQAIANAADRVAESNVVDVMTPKVGANKIRFGRMAADVAPTVARETSGLSLSGLSDSVAAKLEEAGAGLDEAANARNPNLVHYTKPILDKLQAARDRLTASTVREGATTAGVDVVPSPNKARVAQIDQAMQEIKDLGSVAKYEPLRRIREAYDGPAKAIYNPSMTTDFLTAQGGKMGAADVTAALREHLATLDPGTAAANAEYSLWRKASDVLTAAQETERVRPTVGRTLMARGLGAMAGSAAGSALGGGIEGSLGAAAGAIVGPLIESALTGLRPAFKLAASRYLASMADAIRAGDVGKLKAAATAVQRMGLVKPVSVVPMDLPKAAQGTEP